ncbi:MAG TPA: response regulator transcription factor [Actinomycetota bacterium]|jgi:two-component system response regulator RegX3|nr:response regulator transcription factor [Actinomycetota bacterium]
MGTEPARILLVEDERSLAESVRYNLEREGYSVITAADGEAGLERFRADRPRLVILDLMLPKLSGFDVCRAIRRESEVPIIMLTAKNTEADKVAGLELGADDYVTKPFSMRELVSRVRANLRRAGIGRAGTLEQIVVVGPVEMDVARHEVRIRGTRTDLPPKEFELLETFLRRRGRLLTREFLIDTVWGPEYFGDTKTLDVHIKRLRQKIEADPHHPEHLMTVRGLGYKFVE